MLGTAPGGELVFRAKNDWKLGWKQLGRAVGSAGAAIGGERAADLSLTYFIVLFQVSLEERRVPSFRSAGTLHRPLNRALL